MADGIAQDELARTDEPWLGQLSLVFAKHAARTVLRARAHHGPYRIQRCFHPEPDGRCHVYVLHPPGGLAAGDVLRLDVHVTSGAQALVTTPAAGKLYRSRAGRRVHQTQHLTVDDDAALEWLPLETIAFDATRAELATHVELAERAVFLGWEMLCLGRPACDEPFADGSLRQRIELWRRDRPLFIERSHYEGGGPSLHQPWGLGGFPVVGTFLCAHPRAPRWLELARVALPTAEDGERVGVTVVGEVLVARWLGQHTERGQACFQQLWRALRPEALGCPASPPRIWAT